MMKKKWIILIGIVLNFSKWIILIGIVLNFSKIFGQAIYTVGNGGGVSCGCRGVITSLPIELLNFNAQAGHNNEVKLTWQTASEINNDYFSIERSIDGRNFTTILTENGAGNSNEILSYTAVDDNPYKEVAAYYRLKQTDFDGAYTYSKIIALTLNQNNNRVNLSVYPNPATNQLTVSIPFDKATITVVFLSIINQQGALVQEVQYTEYNTANQTIFLDNLSAGIYLLRYRNEEGYQGAKMFLVNN